MASGADRTSSRICQGASGVQTEGFAGANYGWPTVEHGPTSHPRFRGPVHYYPTASIVGGAFAPENLGWPKDLRGRYFFMDFVHGWIKMLDPDRPGQATTFATGLRRPWICVSARTEPCTCLSVTPG